MGGAHTSATGAATSAWTGSTGPSGAQGQWHGRWGPQATSALSQRGHRSAPASSGAAESSGQRGFRPQGTPGAVAGGVRSGRSSRARWWRWPGSEVAGTAPAATEAETSSGETRGWDQEGFARGFSASFEPAHNAASNGAQGRAKRRRRWPDGATRRRTERGLVAS
jgi:hypothetical protein